MPPTSVPPSAAPFCVLPPVCLPWGRPATPPRPPEENPRCGNQPCPLPFAKRPEELTFDLDTTANLGQAFLLSAVPAFFPGAALRELSGTLFLGIFLQSVPPVPSLRAVLACAHYSCRLGLSVLHEFGTMMLCGAEEFPKRAACAQAESAA